MATNSKIGKKYTQNRPSNIILPRTKSLSVQSIKTWKDSLTLAQLPDSPNRLPLLQVYDSILIDSHLQSILESRILRILGSKFKFINKAGTENKDLNNLFKKKWFAQFLTHSMWSRFLGTGVVELWDLDELGELTYCGLIPRENTLTKKGLIVKEVGDEKGYPYKEGPLETYYIQVGEDDDLGILAKAAPDALTKKFAKAAWAEYVEKYGIPPRVVTTDSHNDKRIQELADMLQAMVSNHWVVLQGNEKLEMMPTSGVDAHSTFDNLITRMNSEMSKRILGQDGTTDSKDTKGTYGSLKVLEGVADDRHNSDKAFMEYLINDELVWRLELISPAYSALREHRFEWDNSKELTPEELVDLVNKISSAGYIVDPKYIEEKTSLPIIGRVNDAPTHPNKENDKNEKPGEGEKKKPNPQGLTARAYNEITAFYALETTGAFIIEALDISPYTRLIQKIAKDLQSGKLKTTDLDEGLVRKIFEDLNDATAKGYGKSLYNYKQNAERKLQLQQNVFKFSAAKAYQEQAWLNYLLKDENGNPRTSEEFMKEALKMNLQFNNHYLHTEVQTFQRASAQAAKWAKYESQKGVYPNLQYKTANDKRVRDEHDAIADTIKAIDDAFWDRWYPPNGWNCRCYVIQTTKPADGRKAPGNPTMGFDNNVGKSGQPVDPEHPYYIFPKKEADAIRKSFEGLKLKLPFYQTIHKKGKVKLETSIWADPADISENIKAGKLIVENLKLNVKIRPHSKLSGVKNPEFEIKGINGDLSKPKSTNISRAISNSFDDKFKKSRQLRDEKNAFLVIDFTYKLTSENIGTLARQSWAKFNKYENIDFIIINTKTKSVMLKRELLKEGYEKYAQKIWAIEKGD